MKTTPAILLGYMAAQQRIDSKPAASYGMFPSDPYFLPGTPEEIAARRKRESELSWAFGILGGTLYLIASIFI